MYGRGWNEDRVRRNISDFLLLLQLDYPNVKVDIDEVYSYYRGFNISQIHHMGKISASLLYVLKKTSQPYTFKEMMGLLDLSDPIKLNYKRFIKLTGNENISNSANDFIPRYSFYAGLDQRGLDFIMETYAKNRRAIDSISNGSSIKAKALIYFCCNMNDHSTVRGAFSDALRISDITMARVAEKIGAKVKVVV